MPKWKQDGLEHKIKHLSEERLQPTLIFSRNREVVFGESYLSYCPHIESLMKVVMDSLDPLPMPGSNNTSVTGTTRLLGISTFSEMFKVLEMEGDSFVIVEEEPGCIHYDTLQTRGVRYIDYRYIDTF